jgi:hypothetical protein
LGGAYATADTGGRPRGVKVKVRGAKTAIFVGRRR